MTLLPRIDPSTDHAIALTVTAATTAATPTPTAIAVEDLAFSYPDCPAVLGAISLTVQPGERVALIGHNGCGKTTLFQILCGILTPQAGQVSVLGRPVVPGEFRPEINLLFQDPDDQLFSASVREDIAFGPQNMGLSTADVDRRVQAVLHQTGLYALADRPPHHLSGGEKQMVAIAGLLAMQPQIVLYDEPTANLDLRTRRRLIQFLQQAPETIVIASHDLEFVLEVCDRVILLDRGGVVADGKARVIMGNPALMTAHGLEKPHSLIPHETPHRSV